MTRREQAIARSGDMAIHWASRGPQWAEPSRSTLRRTDPAPSLLARFLARFWAFL